MLNSKWAFSTIKPYHPGQPKVIYDFEVYPNHTCLCTYRLDTDKIKVIDGVEEIAKINLEGKTWIGFNNRYYDHPIFRAIKAGFTQDEVFKLSRNLITQSDEERFSKISYSEKQDVSNYVDKNIAKYRDVIEIGENDFTKDFEEKLFIVYCSQAWDHNIIDLLEICPKQAKCSLKEFGHRLKYPVLQNLPYDPDMSLDQDEWEEVLEYCQHDVRITRQLWEILKTEQSSREMLLNLFDITPFGGSPRMAEKAILSKFKSTDSINVSSTKLKRPENLLLEEPFSTLCDEFLSHDYDSLGKLENMKAIHKLDDLEIQFGMGGIHGFSSPGVYTDIYDYDISSYYPALILNCELGGESFRRIYRDIFNERIALKNKKDKRADALKLILNSLYGKMLQPTADRRIFAPKVALNLCLLGQFYIIDWIQKCPKNSVLYANTDGIMTRNRLDPSIIEEFSKRTGFLVEEKKVKTMIAKDVNGYYIEYEDGSVKRKKEFLDISWDHNSRAAIIQEAVVNYFMHDIPLEDTIMNCGDPFKFMFFTKAKTHDGSFLYLDNEKLLDPKIRFYVSIMGKKLVRETTKTKSAIMKDWSVSLCMNTDDFSFDNLSFSFYLSEAKKLKNAIVKE